jgi:uncharacterized protein (TIGR03083 family)
MTSTADRAISALRTGHDSLTTLVRDLPPSTLTGPSGASEWSVAQVLSHLGSGAEIGLAGVDAALSGGPPPAPGFNHSVWDRWNAMSPPDQANGFLTSNEALVRRYESLDEQTRQTTKIDLGFLPAPVDVATAASFRLNEFALHTWDVAVAVDPDAALAPEAVELLLNVAPYLFGWLGKPGSLLDGRAVTVAVRTSEPEREFGLDITDKTALIESPSQAEATLTLPAESWLRLVSGRLAAAHTPAAVRVTGEITLDQLRQIFPGY